MAKDVRRMTMTYFKNQIDRGKKYVTVGDRNYFKKMEIIDGLRLKNVLFRIMNLFIGCQERLEKT
ncbi:hypothetical protein [Enterococcus faecium]|uniref:hypothetical protein n=1 Tax=Enterococcus faecium TaxID=1352 RepID=UPI0002A28D20|nr:hypothetical protein [Enterococcus faecium]EGP5118034.1 hypothetical protein [Enterococcus faecium]ELB67163.1 hypothetical protein OKY_03012 [Enterococcus faecium EnGen0048]KAA9171496.1 hypothetical protein F6X81_06915 [Enterococcus faecium]KAA9201181.1 hypothetical protein F6X75_07005 [Enterococcus faecium]KAA9201811.1 hypothetical protein F6X82_07000 [Enterococcus faecium]